MSYQLYSRQHCHLCDAFEHELASALPQLNYQLMDVDADPTWQQKYGNDVPVLVCDDEVICQHFFDQEKILKRLK